MALLAITIIGQISYIILLLPLVVANGPNNYGCIIEPIMDLINDVLRYERCDPEMLNINIRDTLSSPKVNKNSTPYSFGNSRKIIFEVPFFLFMAED